MQKKHLIWASAITFTAVVGAISTQIPLILNESPSSPSNTLGLNISQPAGQLDSQFSGKVDDTLGSLHKELRAIRHQLAALSNEQWAVRQELDDLSRPELLPDVTAELTPDSADQIEQEIQQQQTLLEEQLVEEKIDIEWADETIEALNQNFEKEEMEGINLVDATCRSTLCQVDLAIDEELSAEEGLQRLSMHRSWDGPTYFSADPNGQVRLFFARSGHDLPEVGLDSDS